MEDKGKSLEQLIYRLCKLGSHGMTLKVVALPDGYEFKFGVDIIRMLNDEEYNKVVKGLSAIIHNCFRYLGVREVPKYFITIAFENRASIDKEIDLLMKDIDLNNNDFTELDNGGDYSITMSAFNGRYQYGYNPMSPNHLNMIADIMDEMDILYIWFGYEGEEYEYDDFYPVSYTELIEEDIDTMGKDLMAYIRNNASKYPLLSLFKRHQSLGD